MASRPVFQGLSIAASGLSAQRARIRAAAANVANAETTRAEDGSPYRRRVVLLAERRLRDAAQSGFGAEGADEADPSRRLGGVEVLGVAEDPSEGEVVYDPGHPDADEDGYVRMPNVDLTTELVGMMEARRLYEANATVFEAVKSALRRAARL